MTTFGGPYYNSYPLQMFDRKLRPMSTVYVGLVCTKRQLTGKYRQMLIDQTPGLQAVYDAAYEAVYRPVYKAAYDVAYEASFNASQVAGAPRASDMYGNLVSDSVHQQQSHTLAAAAGETAGVAAAAGQIPAAKAAGNDAALLPNVQSFYTFHFGYFSDNQCWSDSDLGAPNILGDLAGSSSAEPPGKKSKHHYEDAAVGATFDPFVGLSDREWGGMVGAWKVGKVLDIAAQKKDMYYGGPVDTAERITVSVDVEFLDWRALRRALNRPSLGGRIPGAAPWVEMLAYSAFWTSANESLLKQRSVGGVLSTLQTSDASSTYDGGTVLQWPTEYTQVPTRASGETPNNWANRVNPELQANAPKDPMTIDQAVRSDDRQRDVYDITDAGTRRGYQRRRAELARFKLYKQATSDGVAPWDPAGAETRWDYEQRLGLPLPIFADLTVDPRTHTQQGMSVDGTSTAGEWVGGPLIGGSAALPVRRAAVTLGEHEFDPLWSNAEQWQNYVDDARRAKNYRLAGVGPQAAGLRQRVIGARRAFYATPRVPFGAAAATPAATPTPPDETFINQLWDALVFQAGAGGPAVSKIPYIVFRDTLANVGGFPTQSDKAKAFEPFITNVNSTRSAPVVLSLYRYISVLDVDADGEMTKQALELWFDPENAERAVAYTAGANRPFLALSSRELQLARDVATPMEDGTLPDVVVPPIAPPPARSTATSSAATAAPKGKGKAAASSAAPPKPKPTAKPAAPASVASMVMAPPPTAAPAVAPPAATATQAAPPRPAAAAGGVRRGRGADGGSTDVFNSIFGGSTTPAPTPAATASTAEDPAPSPSARSEGSDGGGSGGPASRGGRVRRSRDGR